MPHLMEQMTAYCPGGHHLQMNEFTVYLAHENEHFWSLIQVRTSQISQSTLFTNKAEKKLIRIEIHPNSNTIT